jgi:hypothetical protein
MAGNRLRAMPYQVTRKVEAGYKPSHTTETFIGTRLLAAGIFI